MKKFNKILILLITAFGFVACTEKFDDPEPEKTYIDSDFASITPIKNLKQIYYDKYGDKTIGKGIVIENDIVIKGKVISSDLQGNIYRSLYIQDASGAIEIKIGKGQLYNEYPIGRILYIKAKGLTLGNYRYNLSIGAASSEEAYANGYIDVKSVIDEQVLKGEITKLTSTDTLVVTESKPFKDPDDLGRLCRFEKTVSTFGTFKGEGFSKNDIYPSFLESKEVDGVMQYNSYTFESKGKPNTWAYKYGNDSYYGSCLFVQGTKGYVVRSSGYSKFALKEIPKNGEIVDITAILTKYSSSTGGFIKYQLVLNKSEDIK